MLLYELIFEKTNLSKKKNFLIKPDNVTQPITVSILEI